MDADQVPPGGIASARSNGRARWLWPLLLTAAAAAVYAIPWLATYPLHRDEALYGSWARLIASGADPWLLAAWVDKPPLVLYLLAGSIRLFGVSERALRVPGMLACLALIPTTYGLARRLAGPRGALLAALLVAASPYTILFAPTAFTDPWLALWLALAGWAAVARRPFWAGLALALAIASKQTGLFGIPLVLGLLVVAELNPEGRAHSGPVSRWNLRATGLARPARPNPLTPFPTGEGGTGRPDADAGRRNLAAPGCPFPVGEGRGEGSRGVRMAQMPVSALNQYRGETRARLLSAIGLSALGCALGVGPVVWWDSLRWATRPSFWLRSLETYGGLGLAAPGTWADRLAHWVTQLGYLWGLPLLSAAVLGLAVVAGVHAFQNRRWQPAAGPLAIVAGYVVVYLVGHFFSTFQPWDRYLLPLVPWLAILGVDGMQRVWEGIRETYPPVPPPLREGGSGGPCPVSERTSPPASGEGPGERSRLRGLAVLAQAAVAAGLLVAAGMGVAGRVPVGSDHSAYAGVDRLAALVRSQPAGTIVYHRSLGWYFDYYLFGSGEEPLWSNDAATLAADAARTAGRQPARGQWLALASADDAGLAAQAQSALAAEGLSLDERQQVYRPDGSVAFTLYQIVVPPQEQAAALPGAALPGDPLPGGGLHAGAR